MKKLTKKQLEVMKILWNNTDSMIASEIEKSNASFNMNTVQASLRELLKKNYIKVDDIVYSGTVLTRSYKPIVTREQYLKETCDDINGVENSRFSLCASLIQTQTNLDELQELEKLIKKRKKEIEAVNK